MGHSWAIQIGPGVTVVPPQAKQINHQYDFQGDAFKKDMASKPPSPPSEEQE
jgi:hypothetical protein